MYAEEHESALNHFLCARVFTAMMSRMFAAQDIVDQKRRGRRSIAVVTAQEWPLEIAGESPSPGRRMDLERALRDLPQDLRSVVVLHDVEGLAHGEVGRLLAISEEASRSRLSRARRQLRLRLVKP